jgi:hypothetical protein
MKFDQKAAFSLKSLSIGLAISFLGALIFERGGGVLRILTFTVVCFFIIESLIAIKLLVFSDPR